MSSRRFAKIDLFVMLAVMALALTMSVRGHAQEFVIPEVIDAPVVSASPFAVGSSTRQTLPPVDCWRCFGPMPCAPCDCHQGGFLYYGTYPWDDDCENGFDDCPGGNCGHAAVRLSRAWIQWHAERPRLWKPRQHGGDQACDPCDCLLTP